MASLPQETLQEIERAITEANVFCNARKYKEAEDIYSKLIDRLPKDTVDSLLPEE